MHSVAAAGIAGVIAQADVIQKFVTFLLFVMSITTWYLILTKTWELWRARRRGVLALEAFSHAQTLPLALETMRNAAAENPYSDVAAAIVSAATHHRQHVSEERADAAELSQVVALAGRRSVRRAVMRLESGLAVLASIGATAPFVGLFGTVWGIYHALIGIGFTAQATIDKVAGPVGEALIMTAFGLAVAIPAVLGYNFLVRVVRTLAIELQDFAHDVQAYVTTGVRPLMDSVVPPVSVALPRGYAAGGK
jgi:biopolymer transport protein ExbB